MTVCRKCGFEILDLNFCTQCGDVLDTTDDLNSNKYEIYLSYQRNGGKTMAILLHDRLAAKGYSVFLDIANYNTGKFSFKLFNVIDDCKDFLLVCSKGCLDHCFDDDDWTRIELAYALQKNKNIVPIIMHGFSFPNILPYDIENARMKNSIFTHSHASEDETIDELAEKFLISCPFNIESKN